MTRGSSKFVLTKAPPYGSFSFLIYSSKCFLYESSMRYLELPGWVSEWILYGLSTPTGVAFLSLKELVC